MRRLVVPALVVLALGYIVVRVVVGVALTAIDTPYAGRATPSVDVTIGRGASAAQVAEQLEQAGVVENARTLRLWMRYNGTAGRIHTGEYRFADPLSVRQVAEIITEGRVALDSVTILEGATRWEVAEALAAAGFGTREQAWEATAEAALVDDLDPTASDLEGFLFPDTYFAPRDSTAADLVAMMVARFRRAWTVERRALAADREWTLREVLTLASMIEAETGRVDERGLVSGVYHNRLELGMLMQCDPTLLYALRLDGRTDRNIRRSDFDNPSPYNTYRVAGLPPGPIGNPGEASLDAALSPEETDYLYFVGKNDGSHAFSRTLREHNANVNRYQR